MESLNSIVNQTYIDYECIIIDDDSDQNNLANNFSENLNKDKRFKLYKRPKDLKKGPSSCRNYGLSLAKGDYIQFFDDDDEMYPTMLEDKIKAFKKDIDVVVAPLDFYDVKEKRIVKQNKIISNNLIEDYITGKVSWFVSGPIWRRSFLKEYFDEEIETLDDWDFNLRQIYRMPNIIYFEKSLQKYNRFPTGETLSTKAQLGNERQIVSGYNVYKKHYEILQSANDITYKMSSFFYKRFLTILKTLLNHKKKNNAKQVFKFLIRNFLTHKPLNLLVVSFGYFAYKFTGKGYSILKWV